MAFKSEYCTVEMREYNAGSSVSVWNSWRTSGSAGSYTYKPDKKWKDTDGRTFYRLTVLRFKAPEDYLYSGGGMVTLQIPVRKFCKGIGTDEATASNSNPNYHTPSDNNTRFAIRCYKQDPTGGAISKIGAFTFATGDVVQSYQDGCYTQCQVITRYTRAADVPEYNGFVNGGLLTVPCVWNASDENRADDGYFYIALASEHQLELGKPADYKAELLYYAWTAGSSPTLSVTDNKNNTATLSGTIGKAGDENALSSVALYYTTDGSNPKSSSTRITKSLAATSGTSYKETIDLTKNCTVKAYTECKFKYNTTSAEASASATFYPTPLKPASVKLEESSLKNNRLIIKQPWTFTWSASANAEGYFIMLMKCPEGSESWEYVRGDYASSTSDDYITIEPGANDNESLNYFTKRQSTSCTAIFKDPSKLGISPGDKIRLRVKSFNIDGAGNTLQGDGVENTTDSPEYLVQNAGVVNVKVGGKWVEGQVWVKVNNEWKEAETVSTKVNGYWKESQ
jgi:hypothetical protein